MIERLKQEAAEGWHLDKRVPLTIILTILIQTSAIIWWASGISSAQGTTESKTREMAADISEEQSAIAKHAERLSTTEEGQRAIKDSLNRIDSKLDRLIESRP